MVQVAQAMWSGCAGYVGRLRRLCGGLIENKAKLSPAKLGLRLSLAIKKVPNAFPISTNYLHSIPSTKKFQFEAISLLVHTFPRVAQAMWWVAQAMWSGLRRLCGGVDSDYIANLSSAEA